MRKFLLVAALGVFGFTGIFALFLAGAGPAHADDIPSAFLPTWRLLGQQEKQQFIAGYIYGWRDAAKVTAVAINFVKQNPEKAVEGLESLKAMYELPEVQPTSLVTAIDTFFQDPKNREAGLSAAISEARRLAH